MPMHSRPMLRHGCRHGCQQTQQLLKQVDIRGSGTTLTLLFQRQGGLMLQTQRSAQVPRPNAAQFHGEPMIRHGHEASEEQQARRNWIRGIVRLATTIDHRTRNKSGALNLLKRLERQRASGCRDYNYNAPCPAIGRGVELYRHERGW